VALVYEVVLVDESEELAVLLFGAVGWILILFLKTEKVSLADGQPVSTVDLSPGIVSVLHLGIVAWDITVLRRVTGCD
jgi:hypothetical protein